MKHYSMVFLLVITALVLPSCSKDGSQEEKIRITIEKPDAQKKQEPAPQHASQAKQDQPEPAKPKPPAKAERPPESRQERPAPDARPQARAADRPLDFRNVAEHLDLTKYSKHEIKEYWLSIRGKRVHWAGTVYQARTSRKGFKILVENHNAPTRSGYNIVLLKKGPADIGEIAKGTEIRFSGVIIDVEAAKAGSGPIIVLADTKIQR